MGLFHPERDQLQLEDVLAALGNPLRLRIVCQLAQADERVCGSFAIGVTKATATHHWRVLRESGIVRQWQAGRCHYVALRRSDLETRFPGLLDVVLKDGAKDGAEEHAEPIRLART
ncbi:MAG: helix-turn-helix domain-containing protein [Streptosporangiales bacterium]|nr:helix-turn-helix domain-containing protein [Streptosporangiales bacterium]